MESHFLPSLSQTLFLRIHPCRDNSTEHQSFTVRLDSTEPGSSAATEFPEQCAYRTRNRGKLHEHSRNQPGNGQNWMSNTILSSYRAMTSMMANPNSSPKFCRTNCPTGQKPCSSLSPSPCSISGSWKTGVNTAFKQTEASPSALVRRLSLRRFSSCL